ncbi:sigma-70 family RNA polymerase sigma factor [Limnoglobus roseus]|uniref:Secretory protein n=1 Tax=Limnoglobus roseus TaxID=2598579 RepID=A0A5C1AAJ2_9BACT|nr:sigma-70 family RNA polymerase sigma factor [Limnoglobus roseus]QEL15585.1 secretory protein [Limnoglobus roseus]
MSNGQQQLNPAAADGYVTDGELLHRFGVDNNAAAFAAVLDRHGPMVLRVCQRVLEAREDAEDAFQATFLVLARKVKAVTWRESIGTWLYETAFRLSREVRRNRTRRKIRDARSPIRPNGDALAEVTGRELLATIDEEILALPEEYREPLLLCCMEGMSGDEVARQLSCSASTVKRRLHHARELLHARLVKRGVVLSLAGMTVLLASGSAAAGVPVALASNTTAAAASFGSGAPVASGLVSPAALALAGQSLAVAAAKVKILVGLLVVSGCIGTAAFFADSFGRAGTKMVPAQVARSAPRDDTALNAVLASVRTTLPSRDGFIRQYAFDGNPLSCFMSATRPGAADHFTITFDAPVAVKSLRIQTGDPTGHGFLTNGQLEVSDDGREFQPLGRFESGEAVANPNGRTVTAVRVRVTAPEPHALLIREITIDSAPAVAVFRYPVEFVVDATDAPALTEWAGRAARACEQFYPVICDELASDGFVPPPRVLLSVRWDADALVSTSGNRITASAGYFQANPSDVGAVVHATSFVVQAYGGRATPGWLVHGVADYVRFFKFEKNSLERPDPATARYDGDSRETADFLNYVTETYDLSLVRRLNDALRSGHYSADVWKEYTGKSLPELDAEWHRNLGR